MIFTGLDKVGYLIEPYKLKELELAEVILIFSYTYK